MRGKLALLLALCALLSAACAVGVFAQTGLGESAVLSRDADLYRDASMDRRPMGRLEAGTTVLVRGVTDGWVEIEYMFRRAYVERGALSVSAAETDAAIGITLIGRTLYVARETPLKRPARQPVTMRAGDEVTLLGVKDDTAEVLFGIYPGNVSLDALAVDSELCYILNAPGDSITDLQERLEALGFFDGVPDGIFDLQTAGAVIRFRVQAGLADTFEMNDEVEARLFAPEAPLSFIVLAHLSPGNTGNSVKRLQERLIAKKYLETEMLGVYDSLTAQAVMLYQSMERLPETGEADPDTLSRLFSSGARTLPRNLMPATADTSQYLPGGVVVKDWFESDIQEVFAKETVAQITDVITGLSWYAMRRGGYNHADVQPLTTEDTATFLTAVGGEWTWERRPIWVTINGVRYAASMNCMPHGQGAVEANNFAGHHCVHFLNSRTHATDTLDERHQACVEIAASTDTIDALEVWLAVNEAMVGTADED